MNAVTAQEMSDEIARLKARVAALEAVLRGVSHGPHDRLPCWCNAWRPDGREHTEACKAARALLSGGA